MDDFEVTDRINELTAQVNANTAAVISMQEALDAALQNPIVHWLLRRKMLPWRITRERYFQPLDYAPVIPVHSTRVDPEDDIAPQHSDDLAPPDSRPYRRRRNNG